MTMMFVSIYLLELEQVERKYARKQYIWATVSNNLIEKINILVAQQEKNTLIKNIYQDGPHSVHNDRLKINVIYTKRVYKATGQIYSFRSIALHCQSITGTCIIEY